MASNNRRCLLTLILTVWLCANPLHAAITGFVETFNGNGPFTSMSGLSGLDNDGWNVPPSGPVDGGLELSITGPPNQQGLTAAIVYRPITGMGSFVERVELSNVEMYIEPHNVRGVSLVRLAHGLAPAQSMTGVHLAHIDRTNENGGVLPEVPYWSLVSHAQGIERVPAVESFALEHHFDYPRSEVSSVYEVYVDGEIQRHTIGPIEIDDPVTVNQQSYFEVSAAFEATSKARIDHWSLMPLFDPGQGDFDEDGVLDIADIALLHSEIRNGLNPRRYDLNADTVVDSGDVISWLHWNNTYAGDANLDGEFSSSDFVQVFTAGEYEDNVRGNSSWETGDWNADGEFNTRDFVFAFQDGGYEKGPRVVEVPEPSTPLSSVIFSLFLSRSRKRCYRIGAK